MDVFCSFSGVIGRDRFWIFYLFVVNFTLAIEKEFKRDLKTIGVGKFGISLILCL